MLRKWVALVLLVPGIALAGPDTLVHSGRVLDVNGAGVSGTKLVDVVLLDAGGAEQYREQHSVVFEDGYYAVQVGTIVPLSPALFSQSLDVSIEVNGDELGRQPLAAVPYALSVDGLVRVSSAPAVCTAAGTLRWETDHLEVCNGTDWTLMDGRVPLDPQDFFLHMENGIVDGLGNVAFSPTSQAIFNSGLSTVGSYSLSPNVYGAGAGSAFDWAGRTDEQSEVWAIDPAQTGDFAVEWDYRHTSDVGWEVAIVSNTHSWDTAHNTWCRNDGGTSPLPEGWALMVNWQAYYVCFNTDTGAVTWPFSAKDTLWRHLKVTRTGTTLEFFVDGVSKGTRSMPVISDDSASYLYISGSSNGTQGSYVDMSYSLNEQVDELHWTWAQ